jgi:hypothetical protein
MSFGRAMLLGLALASAVAAQLAADPLDPAAPASLTPIADGGEGMSASPPLLAIAVIAPALPGAGVVASTADPIAAPPLPAAAPPLWFAPKTSPPQT